MIELRRRYSGSKGSDSPSFSRLPKEYQEVEWVQPGVKGAFIQTGVLFGDDTKTTVDFMWEDNPSADFSFVSGVFSGSTDQYAISKVYGSNTECYARSFYHPNYTRAYVKTSIAGKHLAVLHNDYVILDGEKSENFGNVPSNIYGYEVPLFASFQASIPPVSNFSLCKIYSVQIEQGGVLIRDFIPCYRISDRVAGMYDIANDVFYTNAGTGEFLVGPDVHYNFPPGYQRVEYLEDSGTQYIELPSIYRGFKGSIKAKFEFLTIDNSLFQYRFALGWSDGAQVGLVRISDTIRKWYNCNTSDTIAEYNKIYNTRLVIDENESDLYVDGMLVMSSTVFNNNLPLTLYRLSTTTQYKNPLYGKIYEILIEGSTNMHLIPCYRKEDNVAGMYDLVNGEFYTNAGTGEFIVGPDVIG